uniref:Acyl-peptide hydrolase n=2 Tax=Parascaris univalens TaxID=6257 RepID=A0A915CHM1_PARUN
ATISDYGSWHSNIDADIIVSGNCKAICELQATNESVFWIEQLFLDGRRCIFESRYGGVPIQWTPPHMSVRNRVHEYGGGSFIVVDGSVLFVTTTGIYRQQSADSAPEVIFEGGSSRRFADLFYSGGNLYVVEEVHSNESHFPQNRISRISSSGDVEPFVSGADFYAWPRVSPDGKYFSWMQWNLPFMPWDETSIRVAQLLTDGTLSKPVMELSSKDVNFHAPEWDPESRLYVISDQTNWWNVYSVDIAKGRLGENVFSVNEEIGTPQWQFADRQYATNQHGILMNVSGKLHFKWRNGNVDRLETPLYTQFRCLALNTRNIAYCVASGPTRSSSLIRIDVESGEVTVVRESRDAAQIDSLDISVPELIEFSSGGYTVSGWFYPPFSRSFVAPQDALPPVVLMAHGGPTANATNSLDMKMQYFTSRGFAVFDVNYRGSTGFGTKYRNLLRRQWGVMDRDDMISAAKYLVSSRRVDENGVCIMGSSAGGYLLLSTILHSDIIKAAASLYGDTHKFEYGYNEQLIGKYPEEAHIYESRSPIRMVDRLHCPVAFFHGDEDAVVPLSQSISLHNVLKARGVPTMLLVFPDEGHGFRGTKAIKDSLVGSFYFFCRVLGIKLSFVTNEMKIDNLKGTSN